IYLVERNPTWLAKIVARLARCRAAGDRLVVGDLTRAECLVGPFLTGDAVVEASYRTFFSDPDVQVLPCRRRSANGPPGYGQRTDSSWWTRSTWRRPRNMAA